tara:strand:+ start:105 stop:260 length:156 start_codon:yes stop_codon:yes gene_type:complete
MKLSISWAFRVLSLFGIELEVGSHWWSGVGSSSGDITIVVLEDLFISVGEN